MTDIDDPKVYMVELKANAELAPIALKLFERWGAYQVPDTIVYNFGQGKRFALLVYIDNVDVLDKIRSFGPVSFVLEKFVL